MRCLLQSRCSQHKLVYYNVYFHRCIKVKSATLGIKIYTHPYTIKVYLSSLLSHLQSMFRLNIQTSKPETTQAGQIHGNTLGYRSGAEVKRFLYARCLLCLRHQESNSSQNLILKIRLDEKLRKAYSRSVSNTLDSMVDTLH